MYNELFPIVSTTDLERALRFYRDVLGGNVTHEYHGPEGTAVYVGIDIGSSHMGLAHQVDAPSPGPVSLWFYTDDCDAAVEELRSRGVRALEEPADRPRGERAARVTDPDGNELIIAQLPGRSRVSGESLGASLLSPEPARYTRPEYERRFLVSPGSRWRDFVEPYSKIFDDVYIRHTRLRLRTLKDSATGQEFIKLTKKLESDSPYVQMIGSIPLSPMEYELIFGLEGERLRKQRYYHFYGGNVFSIDVFQDELAGLVLCEVEAGSLEELMRVAVPEYVELEVTEDPFFTGGNLCRATREDLMRKLEALGTSSAGPPASSG